ncbi:hypothetical protein BJ138DRAFT_1107047 [Hygrophoropsis aurantiaca]|uniref:Uncharacterized protein n=1 Tax=Hygrophoropsis aurantiaca TaxID=72124 RepID=A0ACB7ZSL0_9AGAM|nr:hypothetical protein BJ138DRAFT_1107047 [Hygrophoropsis aurantiaca]
MLKITCHGCGRSDFTSAGYGRHLAQTRNPQCVAIYQQSQQYSPENESDEDAQLDAQESIPPDVDADMLEYEPEQMQDELMDDGGVFDGDYFGAYGDEDLPWPEDDEGGDGGDDDANEMDEDAAQLDLENGWEPEPDLPQGEMNDVDEEEEDAEDRGEENRTHAEREPEQAQDEDRDQTSNKPFISLYPNPNAGAPIYTREKNAYQSYGALLSDSENVWAPFTSQIDFEVARWAKLRGPGSTAFSDLLKIDGVTEALQLSYKNSRELDQIIDRKLPGRPRFQRQEIVVGGEAFDVYFRDVLECVKALYGDPELAQYLVFKPERHYTDANMTMRMYHDMHTGRWWWDTQKKLDKENPGGTIIPIILSSDKTQITMKYPEKHSP